MNNQVRTFYNEYGMKEWHRLNDSNYTRINFMLHMDFIFKDLKNHLKILDAGCGAGRYSLEFARLGHQVTLFDISDGQLAIAKGKIEEEHLADHIEGYYQGTIQDLSQFKDESFDLVICYGAPLSYVLNDRNNVIEEFKRVLKKDGLMALSVNNKWGILKHLLGNDNEDFFSRPDYWYLQEVLETGDLKAHPDVRHPPRHFFESKELKDLLIEHQLKNIQLAASPCFINGSQNFINQLPPESSALKTLIDLELKAYKIPSMIEQGEFLMIKGYK
jgi:ubiquinone/menaquinone biosynthesis C-methylase UbiE